VPETPGTKHLCFLWRTQPSLSASVCASDALCIIFPSNYGEKAHNDTLFILLQDKGDCKGSFLFFAQEFCQFFVHVYAQKTVSQTFVFKTETPARPRKNCTKYREKAFSFEMPQKKRKLRSCLTAKLDGGTPKITQGESWSLRFPGMTKPRKKENSRTVFTSGL